MPRTSNRNYSVQAAGTNAGTWGAGSSDALNEGVIQIMDANLGGITALSLTNVSPIALTQSQADNGMLRLTGTLTGNIAIGPDVGVVMQGFYCFENLTTGSFTVTFGNGVAQAVLPPNRRGQFFIDGTYGCRVISIAGAGANAPDPVPLGSVMPFYQNAAPTGYTIYSALNDYAFKIVSSAGGVTSGSVDYSTLFGRTATDSHTLTTDEIPAHTHGQSDTTVYTGTPATTTFTEQAGGAFLYLYTNRVTDSTGGGNGHTHPLDMRVKTASVILATKN